MIRRQRKGRSGGSDRFRREDRCLQSGSVGGGETTVLTGGGAGWFKRGYLWTEAVLVGVLSWRS